MVKKTEKSISNDLAIGSVLVTDDQTIEVPATEEFGREMSEEAFMNEVLVIEIATSTNENEPNHVVLSVNGVTQPVFRGARAPVKRKYVEVLARCKETKYSQHVQNPMEPDRIEMQGRTGLVYPFQVLEDPNPKGRAWLNAILQEAN